MEIWPNFFIVGAPKSGTTSLYEYLKNVPGIYMSPNKEPNYFSLIAIPENHHTKPIRDKQKYLQLFQGVTNESIIGEASSNYLSDPEAPKLIHQVSPNARIIINLRDPLERAFSHYLMDEAKGLLKPTFKEELQFEIKQAKPDFRKPNVLLEVGLYYKQVKRYLDTFGEDQVKIIIFEEFIKDTRKFVQDVLEFLGVKAEVPEIVEKTYNPYSKPRGQISKYMVKSGGPASKLTHNLCW